MNPVRALLLLTVPALALAGCVGESGDGARYETLKLDAWKERLDATPDAFLLDVRTPQEYAEGHLPNSTLLPFDQVRDRADELPEDKDAPIFVYCRSGNRSTQASETLADLGYTNVVNLGNAGFPDWARAGYPTETGAPA